jgi:CxxC-x17-CxxC domain-containing protein
MEFVDRVLKCNDCGAEFVFTAGEQLFFHDKQFKNDPKHCKQCKSKRVRGGPRVRSETRTTCSECGAETTVPFKPTQGRPVLCRSCFQKQNAKATPQAETVPMLASETAPVIEPASASEPETLDGSLLGPDPIPELG